MSALERDPQRPNEFGRRLDNRNLIESWLLDKKDRGLEARYVKDKSEFDRLDTTRVDYLLGLCQPFPPNYKFSNEFGFQCERFVQFQPYGT